MLEHLKKGVCEIVRRAQRDGLCKHKSGNFSTCDAKSGYIVTTSTSIDRGMLTPRDAIVMGLDASVLKHIPGLQPTNEASMHLMIYRTREDVRTIVRTHSVHGTTFALLNKPIPAIAHRIASSELTKARISVAPHGHPGTMELADPVAGVCKEAGCFLLEKYGTIAFDTRDICEAYLKVSYTEELAQLYYNALTVHQGKEPEAFSQEELQCWEYPKEASFADE